MAYAGGYAGGYADVDVEPEPEPEPQPVAPGGPLWVPSLPPRTVPRQGRATLRLKVTIVTWAAQGGQHSRHAVTTDVRGRGEAASRCRTSMASELRTRSGVASCSARASLLTHTGDPREDDQVIRFALALLLEHGRTR